MANKPGRPPKPTHHVEIAMRTGVFDFVRALISHSVDFQAKMIGAYLWRVSYHDPTGGITRTLKQKMGPAMPSRVTTETPVVPPSASQASRISARDTE